MRFKENATVYTSDGEKVGSIDRVVMDPATKEVTHVVVREGLLFTTDKVVPVSLLSAATEDKVTLRDGDVDLEQLPEFEHTHYVPVTETEWPAGARQGIRPLYWYPPRGVTWSRVPSYGRPVPQYVVRTEQAIPEGTVALDEGARVISSDGEHVGDVEAVLTDPQLDRATHLLISRGILFTEEKLVPANWISAVLEEEVRLSVSSEMLDELPEYEAEE